MTYVASGKTIASSWTSPSLAAGDLIVVLVGIDGTYTLTKPTGWNLALDPVRIPLVGGGRSGYAATTSQVWWRRVAAAGAVSLTFPSGSTTLLWVQLRGPSALANAAAAVSNSQTFTYPAVALTSPMTGHVLHAAFYDERWSTVPTPTGDTARQDEWVSAAGLKNGAGVPVSGYSRLVVSEKSITSVTSVPEVATAWLEGTALTLVFANVAGPDAPTITAPLAGSADLAAGFTIAWTPSGAQTGYAIRRRTSSGPGSWAWWTGTDWSASTQTVINGTATSVVVPASQFSNGATGYDIAVATVGDATRPDVGSYASVNVVGKAAPTLSTVTVSPLSGSTVTSLTPTVSLSGAAGSGGTLTGYRVRVDQDLGPGWVQVLDTGVFGFSWTDFTVAQAASLTNGAPIRFRGVTVQDGSQESAEVTAGPYTLSQTTPAAPLIAVSPIDHPVSGLPGAQISLAVSTPGDLRLYADDVLIWGPDFVSSTATISDYTVGMKTVVYSADLTTGDGVTAVQLTSTRAYAASFNCGLEGAEYWLSDPLDPSTAVQVDLTEDGDRSIELATSVFRVIGDPYGWVRSGVPRAPDGAFTLITTSASHLAAVLALLTSGKRLLFSLPPEIAESCSIDDPERVVFRPVGSISVSHPVKSKYAWRLVAFSWVSQRVDA